jgi:hypothetical protein
MSAAALLLAAVAAVQPPAANAHRGADHGPQVETARVGATILRSAVLVNGVLSSGGRADAPRSQREAASGHVNFLFE